MCCLEGRQRTQPRGPRGDHRATCAKRNPRDLAARSGCWVVRRRGGDCDGEHAWQPRMRVAGGSSQMQTKKGEGAATTHFHRPTLLYVAKPFHSTFPHCCFGETLGSVDQVRCILREQCRNTSKNRDATKEKNIKTNKQTTKQTTQKSPLYTGLFSLQKKIRYVQTLSLPSSLHRHICLPFVHLCVLALLYGL